MTIIDVIFYGESQLKFELYAISFICLSGTVFLQHLRAELIMGPKFSVFIFVLCLYGRVRVLYALVRVRVYALCFML